VERKAVIEYMAKTLKKARDEAKKGSYEAGYWAGYVKALEMVLKG